MINIRYQILQKTIKKLKDIEKDSLKVKNPSDKITLLAESSRLAIQLGELLKDIYDHEKDPENVGIVEVIDDYLNEVEFLIKAYEQRGIDGIVVHVNDYELGEDAFYLALFANLLHEELKDLWHPLWIQHVDCELSSLVEEHGLDLWTKDNSKVYKFNK